MLQAACASKGGIGSIMGGECELSKPLTEYQLKGRTKNDQLRIDESQESIVRGCQLTRPKPRPASWDVRKPQVNDANPNGVGKAIGDRPVDNPTGHGTDAVKKKHWWQKLHKEKSTT